MRILKMPMNLWRLLKRRYYNSRAKRLGLAKILDKKYLLKRNEVLSSINSNIEDSSDFPSELNGFRGYDYDERVVEYPFFTHWSKKLKDRNNILDVGCVLNNVLVSDHVSTVFDNIWFCNPAVEPLAYSKPVFYHVSKLDNAFEKSDIKFDNITCLSTIEHIGYDNSHYGVFESNTYTEPKDEIFINSILKLISLLNNDGNLLVSVPFGLREALRYPTTLKHSSQVFDSTSMKALEEAIDSGINFNFKVFKATENGWEESNPSECDNIKYAEKTPAAGAVCLMEFKK